MGLDLDHHSRLVDLDSEEGLVLVVGYSLHLVVEDCMERENHRDLLGFHLCHLEGHHHRAVAAGIEVEVEVAHTDAVDVAAGSLMEVVPEEEGEEESCIVGSYLEYFGAAERR